MNKGSFQVLGYIDYKVAHSFEFIHNIHVVDTCLVFFAIVLNLLNFQISKIISLIIDTLFSMVCIGYL